MTYEQPLFQKASKYFYIIIVLLTFGCSKDNNDTTTNPPPTVSFTLNPSPKWTADERCFLKGTDVSSFDGVSVKDPSIVFSDGKWHLFFTGRDAGNWRTGYASATSISGLKTASRTYMSSLNGGGYFCAPQVLYFTAQNKWYLIYQSGLGATFSTNSNINNPNDWSAGKAMGFTDGIDFWCIADDKKVYCFYSAQDGSKIIKCRSTLVTDFPYKWSAPTTTATETFEAPHVYKNKADNKYYMMVEDIARHFELWQAKSLEGTWTKINEKWASKTTLTETKEHWTDQVSHGEILRTGVNEKCEIDNINKCQILIQGVVNGTYSGYETIPYELGMIKNY